MWGLLLSLPLSLVQAPETVDLRPVVRTSNSILDDGRLSATAGDIAIGVGLGVLVAGTVLWLSGIGESVEEAEVE